MNTLQKARERTESPADQFSVLREPCGRTLWNSVFRLALGGAIWGSLLGIFGGAVCGTMFGALRDDLSLGLDGALLGGLVTALAGLIYGGILGVTGRRTRFTRAEERSGADAISEGPASGCPVKRPITESSS